MSKHINSVTGKPLNHNIKLNTSASKGNKSFATGGCTKQGGKITSERLSHSSETVRK